MYDYSNGARDSPACKEEDVDTDERNQCVAGRLLAGMRRADASDNELGDRHADGAEQEQRSAAPALDKEEAWHGTADVDKASDDGDDEGVVDTSGRKVRSSVVKLVRG
jgi:hypothetical protein